MLQNHRTVKLRYRRFLKTVCDTGIVYGLESDEGLASCISNEIVLPDGEPARIICFWSRKAQAKSCIKDEWADYQLAFIPLSVFIENGCVGMSNDHFLAGINFDHNMFGFETDPLELILELIEELKQTNKAISFIRYRDLYDLENQVRAAL